MLPSLFEHGKVERIHTTRTAGKFINFSYMPQCTGCLHYSLELSMPFVNVRTIIYSYIHIRVLENSEFCTANIVSIKVLFCLSSSLCTSGQCTKSFHPTFITFGNQFTQITFNAMRHGKLEQFQQISLENNTCCALC